MSARLLALLGGAAALVSGCAVLTIDVDVYKGALINTERMRDEQIVASAMAAKPMLLQLRSVLHQACDPGRRAAETEEHFKADCIAVAEAVAELCRPADTAGVLDDGCLRSWQARRVNAIIGFYQDLAVENSQLQRLAALSEQVVETRKLLRGVFIAEWAKLRLPEKNLKPASSIRDFRTMQNDMLCHVKAQLSAEVQKMLDAAQACGKAARPGQALVLQHPWRAIRSEMVRMFLSSEENARILESHRASVTALWREAVSSLAAGSLDAAMRSRDAIGVIADLAAQMTDPVELSAALQSADAALLARTLKSESLRSTILQRRLSPIDESFDRDLESFQEALATLLRGTRRTEIAAELLVLHDRQRSTGAPIGLANQILPTSEAEQQRLSLSARRMVSLSTSLQGGRKTAGLETQIQRYMSLEQVTDVEWARMERLEWVTEALMPVYRGLNADADREKAVRFLKKRMRTELFHALTDLAQKVVEMANLQLLLPDAKTDEKRSIRLLQAVGNSILNHIDDYKKTETYREVQEDKYHTELDALRAARGAASGVLVSELMRDIPSSGVPNKDKILAALSGGDGEYRKAAGLIDTELKTVRAKAAEHRAVEERLALARKALTDTDLPAELDKAVAGAADDAVFAKAATQALVAQMDSKARAEEGKAGGGRRKEYEAAKGLDKDKQGLETLKPAKGTSGADLLKAWSARLKGQEDEAAKAREASGRQEKQLAGWLARAETLAVANVAEVVRPSKGDKTAVALLDAKISELEYSRILAVETGNEERREQLDGAIAHALRRRADMQYIRPASIYLRDSYPATVLQREPEGASNLLMHRLSELLKQDELGKVNSEIDKQFWQTINQVSIGGGGSTNYVVAKDDVGNWYVKGYENDVGSIVDSVRGLVLYNASAKLGANLLAKPLPESKDGAGAAPGTKDERSVLGKQVSKATDDYKAAVLKSVEKARASAAAIDAKLQDVFKGAAAKDEVKGLASAGNFPAPGDAPKQTGDAAELDALLGAMVKYFATARDKVKATVKADSAADYKADLARALQAVWDYVRAEVNARVAEADAAGAKMEGRLSFINDVTGANALK